RRIMPTSFRCEPLRLPRPPSLRFVLIGRSRGLQHWIDNPPCFLDVVFASEQCPITSYSLSEDALVSRHVLRGRVTAGHHLNKLRAFFITVLHHRSTKGDGHIGTDAETQVIRRHSASTNDCGRFAETGEHLSGRDRQVLSGSDIERDSFPAPG